MTRCIMYEWIVKFFKLKKCLNCRFYTCGQCTWARTAQPTSEFKSCCHFSQNGYYERYAEFLTKVINYIDDHSIVDPTKYIKSLQKKYLIDTFNLFLEPRYIRLWFRMEGINHFCHFNKSFYELDANVTLKIDKKKVRNL